MTRQGCSTFSTDESNRILDRLAGLEKVITPDQIVQALVATNRVNRQGYLKIDVGMNGIGG